MKCIYKKFIGFLGIDNQGQTIDIFFFDDIFLFQNYNKLLAVRLTISALFYSFDCFVESQSIDLVAHIKV